MACDAEDCGFQILNDDEIVNSVQEESELADDETDEDEDSNNNNESSKSPSNADAFSALETAFWTGTNNRVPSYSTTAVQENVIPCSKVK
ncbi:UNVERIFIED_CONTAM: hypothetical protein NCL1_53781 [Trichonephila clavipes]